MSFFINYNNHVFFLDKSVTVVNYSNVYVDFKSTCNNASDLKVNCIIVLPFHSAFPPLKATIFFGNMPLFLYKNDYTAIWVISILDFITDFLPLSS